MTPGIALPSLLLASASVAVAHTLAGPDHYIPFAAMRLAGRWSRRRLVAVTLLCGALHCLSATFLAVAAVILVRESTDFDALDAWRGDAAGLLLLGVGLAVLATAIRRRRGGLARPHAHGSLVHTHEFLPDDDHRHGDRGAPARSLAFPLVVILVLGPCEYLVPASVGAWARFGIPGLALVTVVFSFVTVATMLVATLAISEGFAGAAARLTPRGGRLLAGTTMAASGVAVLAGF